MVFGVATTMAPELSRGAAIGHAAVRCSTQIAQLNGAFTGSAALLFSWWAHSNVHQGALKLLLLDAVDESHSANHIRQLRTAVQAIP